MAKRYIVSTEYSRAVTVIAMTLVMIACNQKSTPSQLKLTVDTITVATKFLAYVGGGTNISPPDTIGGGDGIPLISISHGTSFFAGEVSSKDEKAKLIKIT